MGLCDICGRDAEDGQTLCRYHVMAQTVLQEKFEEWRTAQDMSWEEYLKEVLEAEDTGAWVKDVIEHSLSKSGTSAPQQSPSSRFCPDH